MPFQPGRSGNPGGIPKDKLWRDAIRSEVLSNDETGKRKLGLLAAKLYKMAIGGDAVAMAEIGNRLDGRAATALFDEMPEGGRLVLVWESPGTSESQSPTLPESSSSPFTIEHSAIPSASPTEGPAKPSPTSTSLSEEP